jgi:hypothetical protein
MAWLRVGRPTRMRDEEHAPDTGDEEPEREEEGATEEARDEKDAPTRAGSNVPNARRDTDEGRNE